MNSVDCSLPAFEEQRKLLGQGNNLVPVNFCPETLEESGFFYGLYHFLGNVEEIIKVSEGAFGAAGGRVKIRLEGMCRSKDGYIDIGPDTPDTEGLRGFRLVVYPSASAAKLAGPDRIASKEFSEVLRKPPMKQPKDAPEAPQGSGER